MRTALRRRLRQAEAGGTAQTAQPRVAPGPGPIPPCPPGWITGPPDFVGLGTKKAGTTWWNEMISSHPGVHRRVSAVPGRRPERTKELHFFELHWTGEFTTDDAARYHAYFPRPPGRLVGEWTPRYLLDCWTPAQLRLAAPDARLLVLVRDPVDRLCSSVTHYLRRHGGLEHPRAIVEEIQYGFYAAALGRLTRHFPPEQVLVLQYERCAMQPEVELAKTYQFLGLDDTGFIPARLASRMGAARVEKVSLADQMKAELIREYEPDARRLAEEWPVDLSLWKHFSHLG